MGLAESFFEHDNDELAILLGVQFNDRANGESMTDYRLWCT